MNLLVRAATYRQVFLGALGIVLLINVGCAASSGVVETVAPAQAAAARTIYLAPLGTSEQSSAIREKVRVELMHGSRWKVTADSAQADVVLTGLATTVVEYANNGDPYNAGTANVRLLSQSDGTVLWTFEYKRGYGNTPASERVPRLIVESLEEIPLTPQ